MATKPIGFAVADEDRERRAERLRALQAANHHRLAEQGSRDARLTERIRSSYKKARG
jgi:hypothetical protein